MIDTVDELIEILEKHKGKKLFIGDVRNQLHSYLFEVEERDNVCVLVKSVRDYE